MVHSLFRLLINPVSKQIGVDPSCWHDKFDFLSVRVCGI